LASSKNGDGFYFVTSSRYPSAGWSSAEARFCFTGRGDHRYGGVSGQVRFFVRTNHVWWESIFQRLVVWLQILADCRSLQWPGFDLALLIPLCASVLDAHS
jgi:hypothetical protein